MRGEILFRSSGFLVKRAAHDIQISSRPSVREDWGVLFFAFILASVVVAKPRQEGVLAFFALMAGFLWWWCRPLITSRFRLDQHTIEVSFTSPAIVPRSCTYDCDQVLVLEAEDETVTMRLLDGRSIVQTHKHSSSAALKEVVLEICDKAGLNSIDAVVVPEPQGRPITFTGNGIGLSIEGPVAVLKGAGSLQAAITVFDNLSRQVAITGQSPAARPVVPYRDIDSIEVEQTNDEAVTYRVSFNLATGHRLVAISGAECKMYEVDFIVRQLSAFSGLHILRAEDKPRQRTSRRPDGSSAL